jgi:hypothetical protein
MTRRWSLCRAGVALVAAYALALQALFASFGAGAALVRQQAAAIAGVTCSGGATSSSLPAPSAPVEHDSADCCIPCGAPALALVDHVVALKLAAQGFLSRLLAPFGADHYWTMAWLPGGARAPPTA